MTYMTTGITRDGKVFNTNQMPSASQVFKMLDELPKSEPIPITLEGTPYKSESTQREHEAHYAALVKTLAITDDPARSNYTSSIIS